jgi:hypothetical protein
MQNIYAVLTINVSGKIKNCQYVTAQTVELIVPEGVIKAAEAGYIVLPDCVVNGEGDEKEELKLTGTGSERTFNYDIEFEWGTKFGGMNPGFYYDNDPTGKQVSGDEMLAELAEFRRLMLGLDDTVSDEDALEATGNLTFSVVIEALTSEAVA